MALPMPEALHVSSQGLSSEDGAVLPQLALPEGAQSTNGDQPIANSAESCDIQSRLGNAQSSKEPQVTTKYTIERLEGVITEFSAQLRAMSDICSNWNSTKNHDDEAILELRTKTLEQRLHSITTLARVLDIHHESSIPFSAASQIRQGPKLADKSSNSGGYKEDSPTSVREQTNKLLLQDLSVSRIELGEFDTKTRCLDGGARLNDNTVDNPNQSPAESHGGLRDIADGPSQPKSSDSGLSSASAPAEDERVQQSNDDHVQSGCNLVTEDPTTGPTPVSEGHQKRLDYINARQTHASTEKDYFQSYADIAIHETMIRDTIRTNAYRDFIYSNKHLFIDSYVLDVGCGTGILSMFAAKAGATKVFAVDNSEIITKAESNVAKNNLTSKVWCVQADVEDLVHHHYLALRKDVIDVLISEWMGYFLLYEGMLDSVIKARNMYLHSEGLMVPSHVTLRIAPVSDQSLMEDTVGFWTNVYGFDYTSMLPPSSKENPHDVLIRHLPRSSIPAEAETFKTFQLNNCEIEDLEFVERFAFTLTKNIDSLDAFAIWFDTFFSPDGNAQLLLTANGERMDFNVWYDKAAVAQKGETVTFTTGPGGKETHWGMGVCLIDRWSDKGANPPKPLAKGTRIGGSITYAKVPERPRELKIGIKWLVLAADANVGSPFPSWSAAGEVAVAETDVLEEGSQTWLMH